MIISSKASSKEPNLYDRMIGAIKNNPIGATGLILFGAASVVLGIAGNFNRLQPAPAVPTAIWDVYERNGAYVLGVTLHQAPDIQRAEMLIPPGPAKVGHIPLELVRNSDGSWHLATNPGNLPKHLFSKGDKMEIVAYPRVGAPIIFSHSV